MTRRTRLGLDLGTNSIGWALYALDDRSRPERLVDAGVRIFSDSRDPESSDPLGKARREARQPRRQRDRRLQRKRRIMAELVRLGLMPREKGARKALEGIDPYELRQAALTRRLDRHELGRALFHLQQRRGFKSNRLGDGDAKETSKVRERIAALTTTMEAAGAATVGAYWRRRLLEGERVRGSFWTAREMLEAEFDAIAAAQRRLDPALPPLDRLRGIVFHQRPLAPQRPGVCTIDGKSPRAPWALPIVQRFRILQEVNNLRVTVPPEPSPRRLERKERDVLLERLGRSREVAFERMKSLLRLPEDARFNLESENRKKLDGDKMALALAHKERFGKGWHDLPPERQQAIAERLIDPLLEEEALEHFLEGLGLDAERAARVARTRLPQGHCHLGLPVIEAIVSIMEEQSLGYAEAAKEAGYHHSDFRSQSGSDTLPYYGAALARWCLPLNKPSPTTHPDEAQHGRIANPTVHVGLNQLRKLVNAVIERYGKPDEIHVELARDLKLGKARLDELAAEQGRNRRRNEEADKAMREAGHDPATSGRGTVAENRRRYRLWLELDPEPHRRCCPFSGRPIGIRALFSADVEIEHILPFARTLDDSMANKTVAFVAANRDKGERSPWEAFHDSPTIGGCAYDWEAIADRGTRLPRNKAWRFGADAMDRFSAEGDFLDRQLNDTTYLSRLTRTYLETLYGREEAGRVAALPGRLTGLLRGKWGLNDLLAQGNWKNRDDHRHHAIDAAIVACTDRGTLQRISGMDERGRERITVPEPHDGFRDELGARLASMIVSHKPEHGLGGKLLDETAYGDTDERNAKGTPLRVVRRGIETFTEAKHLDAIRDPWLREALKAHVAAAAARGEGIKAALASFRDPQGRPLRRIRTLKAMEDAALVPIRDGEGRIYKRYARAENAYMDVLALPNGKWVGYAVSLFEAHRLAQTQGTQPPWKAAYPAARRVMRLFKGDLVRIEKDGALDIQRVAQLWSQGTVFLAPACEGGLLIKRHKDDGDPFRWLMPSASTFRKLKLEPAHVDMLGHLREGAKNARANRRDHE